LNSSLFRANVKWQRQTGTCCGNCVSRGELRSVSDSNNNDSINESRTVSVSISELHSIINTEVQKALNELKSLLAERLDFIDNSIIDNTNASKDIMTSLVGLKVDLKNSTTESNKHVSANKHVAANFAPALDEAISLALNEKEEIEKKQKNLIFFNVPETESGTVEERLITDQQHVQTVMEGVQVDVTVMDVKRIGRKLPNKPRPLIVKMGTIDDKFLVLKSAKNLRNFRDSGEFRATVSIQPDLTKLQQKEHKKLVDEMKHRRLQGENITIRNGKIISLERNVSGQSD